MELSIMRFVKYVFREAAMFLKVQAACDLRRKGYSITQIARKMGVAESTARNYLARGGMIRGC